MNKVRETLKKLIKEVMQTDIDTLDNTKELALIDEWDSFNNLMLISRVEEAYKIKFSIKDIESATTIAKIIALVEEKTA